MYKDTLKDLIMNNLIALDNKYGPINVSNESKQLFSETKVYINDFEIAKIISSNSSYSKNFNYSYDLTILTAEDFDKYAQKIITIIQTQIDKYKEDRASIKAKEIFAVKTKLDKILME